MTLRRRAMTRPSVSVLIPTLRNSKQLEVVLKSLNEQDWDGELHIACVGPTGDPGQQVAEDNGAEWIDDEGSRNRADACNVGIKKLECDILLFTDDDVVPPKDWAGKLIRWFEREEVAGVGGPNFAPDEDPFSAKAADVAFCARWVTAGTRYGKVPAGELVEIDHNPGCNSAYRKAVLDEVAGFEEGCIGAEDVVMDRKILDAGYRLWFDPTAIMPHRRRALISPYMKQLRNYGYVRTLANSRWPALKRWSHNAIGLFPLLSIIGLATFGWGVWQGGIDWSAPFSSPEMGLPRIAAHSTASLATIYLLLCWLGAASGASPHRSIATILIAPLTIFLAHWAYGSGVVRGWKQIRFGGGAAAGLGIQIDDKERD